MGKKREGRVWVGAHMTPEMNKILKRIRIDHGVTRQHIIERALINYLADNYPDYLPEEML